MNFAVLSLPIYLLVRSEFASSCTATYSVQGQVLQNHTINTETADKIGDCILRCMAYPGCTSSNFYRKNKRCELSDKTHASHPDDMRHEPYTIYMVNTFRTIPCKTHNDCGVYLICAPSLVCEECRSAPLGMESRAIQDSAVTASSTWDSRLQPWQARINNELCWSVGTSVVGEWLQVDLGKDTTVTKVATQGRSTGGQWVKSYKILFSFDEANWNEYQIGGVVRFLGQIQMLDQSSRTSWCQELQADIFVFPCCRGVVTYPCELSCMAVPKDYNFQQISNFDSVYQAKQIAKDYGSHKEEDLYLVNPA